MPEDLAELLLAKIKALEHTLHRIERSGYGMSPDARMILAIADVARGDHGQLVTFTAHELLRRGRTAPALRAAIVDACGRLDARVLGHKLVALSAAPLAGFRLISEGAERDGRTWSLRRARDARSDLSELIVADNR
jgi:hypothetical protein